MSELPLNYIKAQARMVGECFQKSALAGIDSDDFARKFMTTEYGSMVVTDKRMIEYSDAGFMLEGFMKELSFDKGESYNQDILWLTGYIYKYWVSTRDYTPGSIYKMAPIKLIADRYDFYHTQDFDYIINDIIERQYIESEK